MTERELTRREFIERAIMAVASAAALHEAQASVGEVDSTIAEYPVGALEPVPAIRQRVQWTRFIVLVS